MHWHDYGKEPRPGRKIGHCTVVAASAVERDRLVRKVPAEDVATLTKGFPAPLQCLAGVM